MVAQTFGSILESQIDWLTCATHTARTTRKWARWAHRQAQTEETPTERVTPFRIGGYEGWHCGRLSFGTREAAGLIQCSGDLARQAFDVLMPDANTVTRIDIAVTVRLSPSQRKPGTRHYNEASDWYRAHPRAARPSYHGDADGGYTLYLGSRTSDRYLRVYDKGAESAADPVALGHYRDCWRYELESKGAAAYPLAQHLFNLSPEVRSAYIADALYSYCYKHGLRPAYLPGENVALVPGFRRRSDRDSRLGWLDRTVKPVVQWLIDTGNEVEVLAALGLAVPNSRLSAAANPNSEDTQPDGPTANCEP
jgi:hypothetical protein